MSAVLPPGHAAAELERVRLVEDRLRLVLWASDKSVWTWDAATGQMLIEAVEANARKFAWPSMPLQQWLGMVDARDLETVRLSWRLHVSGASSEFAASFRALIDGETHWMRMRGRALERDASGRALRVGGTIKDTTEEHQAEESLRLMANTFHSTRDALVVTDLRWRVIESNEAFTNLLGVNAARNEAVLDGLQLDTWLSWPASYRSEMEAHGVWSGEGELRTAATARLPVRISITALQKQAAHEACYIVSLSDLSSQRRAEARLERLALSDTLTGLPNRAALEQTLAQKLAADESFALLFLDLDGFKEINDSFGHDAGDIVLREIARRLQDVLQDDGFLGRWGGDEFVLALPAGSGETEVRSVAQGVIAALSRTVDIDANQVSVTPSIGAVLCPRDGNEVGVLLRKVDSAMYAAKERGRNCLAFYDISLDTDAQRRVRMHALLRVDVERNGFSYVAQPKVDAQGQAVGSELLMRWNTTAFGPVSPVEFIPIAEKIGLIGLMGRHAMHAAARLIARGIEAGVRLPVAVNLSPKQLMQPGLDRQLLLACERAQIEPGLLELELTESALVGGMDVVAPRLKRLRQLGFELALDDFGTGYSSLSYLRHLPFQKIKIDRSFVLDVDQDRRAARMLEHIVRLCADLGMRTVAEGVETEAQFNTLRALGIQEFQGYYFARPMPVDDWVECMRGRTGAAPQLPLAQPLILPLSTLPPTPPLTPQPLG